MKIIKVMGGLGNQMFQYALYRRFIQLDKTKLDLSFFETNSMHNGYELEDVFAVKPEYADEIEVNQVANQHYYYEKVFSYNQHIFNLPGDVYFAGYWQTERYFTAIAEDIRKDFQFKLPLEGLNLEVYNKIKNANSVSLHIRRGDYVNDPRTAAFHGGICTIEYYLKAVSIINRMIPKPVFFVFSDEVEWARKKLRLPFSTHFIDWNYGPESYRDMQLMSLCQHHIIANSSFSWWGAWLNQNKNKIVLAPAKWFNDPTIAIQDILPPSWYRINLLNKGET